MRFKVVLTWHDDGAFGYIAPDMEEVVRDWLTRAEAKAIYRHYLKKYWYEENVTVSVRCFSEDWDEWRDCSEAWAYRELEEQEQWFEDKGFDYTWWLQFDEIRRVK